MIRSIGSFLASIGEWELAANVWEILQNATFSSSPPPMPGFSDPNSLQARLYGDWRYKASVKVFLHMLIEVEQWAEAEAFIDSIVNQDEQAEALKELAEALGKRGAHEQLLPLVQRWWEHAKTREQAIHLLPLAYELIPLKPEIGFAFYEAFDWMDAFVEGL